MKCPIDQTEMEKGVLSGDNVSLLTQLATGGTKIRFNGQDVITYRCPKCGKIELYTEIQEGEVKEKK